ncbi:MAG: cytochrome c [Pseudomonadota bacterium]|nr:cytochrome c [Pseudomonadota bacterium]MEC8846595.1 cytochrome c [Pseudomonadota bacterium]
MLGQPYPNAMPIYDGVLSDKEIVAVLSYIKSQWPAEFQSRNDRLNQRLRAQNN